MDEVLLKALADPTAVFREQPEAAPEPVIFDPNKRPVEEIRTPH
jgi:hypothetical protein